MTPFNFEIPEEYLSKLAEAAVKNQRGHTALLEAKDREIERMTAKFDALQQQIHELKRRIEKLEWIYHRHYRMSLDGKEAVDTRTGLIWRRTVEPGEFTYKQALEHADQVAQQTGSPWRVPTKEEIETLIDRKRKNPAIDTAVFPDMPSPRFWSSSMSTLRPWYVDFDDGSVSTGFGFMSKAVRLVRDGE